jgi:hypothetical protein
MEPGKKALQNPILPQRRLALLGKTQGPDHN